MTKAELIAAMKNFSDHMEVKILINIKDASKDVSTDVNIKNVFSENGQLYIQPSLSIKINQKRI